MKQAEINPFIKIHLAKEKDSLDTYCKVQQSHYAKIVSNYAGKVTCKNCLKKIESMKKIKRPDFWP